MNKLLTITIRRFNRATFLDQQLSWLAKAINSFASECEIIVSYNCSTDNTQVTINKWNQIFNQTSLTTNKAKSTPSVVATISHCFQSTITEYAWVISHDDTIQKRTLEHVINTLKNHPELALVILNYPRLYVGSSKLAHERYFIIGNKEIVSDCKPRIENYLHKNFGTLAFMTTQVYKIQAVQQALKLWTSSVNNVNNRKSQIYWTAFCAYQGSVIISKNVYLEYACGMNYGPREKLWLRIHYLNLPMIYVKLMEIGHSEIFLYKLVIYHFLEKNLRVFLGALIRWTSTIINIIIACLSLVDICRRRLLTYSVF
jgi:glycosyltransferase involved in cell wall biosynthesis